MMSRHDGVSCDFCMKNNFRGPRYKCLVCYDYDLCGQCFECGHSGQHHSPQHAMQCILTRSDYELYYGGEGVCVEQGQAFTCPFCGRLGYTELSLQEHLASMHPNVSTEVVCPVCAAMPGGDPNHMTDDLQEHLMSNHAGSRNSQPPEEALPRSGSASQPPTQHRLQRRTNQGPRAIRGGRRGQLGAGLAALQAAHGSQPIDPIAGEIAELLSQIGSMRRGVGLSSAMSQIQQLQQQVSRNPGGARRTLITTVEPSEIFSSYGTVSGGSSLIGTPAGAAAARYLAASSSNASASATFASAANSAAGEGGSRAQAAVAAALGARHIAPASAAADEQQHPQALLPSMLHGGLAVDSEQASDAAAFVGELMLATMAFKGAVEGSQNQPAAAASCHAVVATTAVAPPAQQQTVAKAGGGGRHSHSKESSTASNASTASSASRRTSNNNSSASAAPSSPVTRISVSSRPHNASPTTIASTVAVSQAVRLPGSSGGSAVAARMPRPPAIVSSSSSHPNANAAAAGTTGATAAVANVAANAAMSNSSAQQRRHNRHHQPAATTAAQAPIPPSLNRLGDQQL